MSIRNRIQGVLGALAALAGAAGIGQRVRVANVYRIECHDADGVLKWTDEVRNLVVNVGLDEMLDKFWKGSSYTAAHYVGVTGGSPTFAAGDTMSSHAGWTDNTTYSNATRPALTLGSVSAQSVDNSASKAQFNINGSATLGGAFVTTNNTKGGTTGILIGGGAFSGGNRSVVNGDTLSVTITSTASSS